MKFTSSKRNTYLSAKFMTHLTSFNDYAAVYFVYRALTCRRTGMVSIAPFPFLQVLFAIWLASRHRLCVCRNFVTVAVHSSRRVVADCATIITAVSQMCDSRGRMRLYDHFRYLPLISHVFTCRKRANTCQLAPDPGVTCRRIRCEYLEAEIKGITKCY